MKLYDIALVLIRAIIAMDVARAVLSFAVLEVESVIALGPVGGIGPAIAGGWQPLVFQLAASAVLWLLSKSIARFAARFDGAGV